MIFLTVGTIFPFDRLTRAVDEWVPATGHEVFGQLGELGMDNYRPKHYRWTERLTPVAFRARVQQADLVVTHAGIGTIVTALTFGKPLVLLPRKPEYKEVVNDHQMETIRRFEGRSGISVALEPDALGQRLSETLAGSGRVSHLSESADDSLIATIQNFIRG